MNEFVYNDDVVALSPYTGHSLITESAEIAWTFHRLLGGKHKKAGPPAGTGILYHAMLLEGGKGVEVIDADAFRTKEAKAARDLAISRGLVPIVRPKYEALLPTVARIKDNIAKAGYSFDGGQVEAKVEWTEAADYDDVTCHGRIDWLGDDCANIIDLKTTEGSVHPDACAASIARDGGAMQEAAYRSAVSSLRPDIAGRESFTFLFVELKEPFSVVPIESDGSMRQLGEMRWQRAIQLWSRCMRLNEWPGYATDGPVRVGAPSWALSQEMMEDEHA